MYKKGEIKLIKNISLMTVDKKHKFYQAEMLSRKILYNFAWYYKSKNPSMHGNLGNLIYYI